MTKEEQKEYDNLRFKVEAKDGHIMKFKFLTEAKIYQKKVGGTIWKLIKT